MPKFILFFCLLHVCFFGKAQSNSWIRRDSTVWGIKNGMVIALWPGAVEKLKADSQGGPRGLLRIGYEYNGMIYQFNYIAIEPVVKGKMEFSEISPSSVDGKWGKFMWLGDTSVTAETMSINVHMEKFANGAHPYLKLTIRKSNPDELCIEVFHHADSAPMERCGVTATMGNYSRLRKLYLKDTVINSKQLFAGFGGIDFIEKNPYPANEMLKDSLGGLIVLATPDESFAQLAAWPQEAAYMTRWNWRYRPFYRLTQYWRKEKDNPGQAVQVRVNGRAKYWSGASPDPSKYIAIPGGPSFENFELREKYMPGQKTYFGMTRKTIHYLSADRVSLR